MTDSPGTSADRYTQASYRCAGRVIHHYSTSFSLATRLLPSTMRRRISAVYALVRVSDEIVDGAWESSTPQERISEVDALEARVEDAARTRFSSDLITHAFAHTATATGITADQWHPFFHSMRLDATQQHYDEASLATYIRGSAEVVGEMCVRIFTADSTLAPSHLVRLDAGAAALGSAFQRINFLRDLADDRDRLQRDYVIISGSQLTEEEKAAEVALIRRQLREADAAIELLPSRVRPAVRCAHGLFSELTDIVAATPAAQLHTTRVSVPNVRKAQIAARSLARRNS